MTKQELANSLAIILNMIGQEAQLMKMSQKALEAMYRGQLKNADAYALALEQVRLARTEATIANNRATSLERSLNRLTQKGNK